MVDLNVNISALHALVTNPLTSYRLFRHHTSLLVQFLNKTTKMLGYRVASC